LALCWGAFYRDRARTIGADDQYCLAFDIFSSKFEFINRCVGCELRRIMHDPIAKAGALVKARADAVTSKRPDAIDPKGTSML
jgi:hypothetical protein